MKLWSSLYLLTWLIFLEIWLALTPIAFPALLYLHIALGVGILVLAYTNSERLRDSTAPARIKRTSRATFQLSVLLAILGFLMFLQLGATWTVTLGISLLGILTFFHFVNAMAVFAQAAAVGISYDMWEEREFLIETRAGEVPAHSSTSAAPTDQLISIGAKRS